MIMLAFTEALFAQTQNIYHKGRIDLNKNGRKDVFEDPTQTTEKRINDLLSRMTVNEKTLFPFGYG